MRSGVEGGDGVGLEKRAGDLVGSQAASWGRRPSLRPGSSDATECRGAVQAERLGGGDHADQATEVVAVRGEIAGDQVERLGELARQREGRRSARRGAGRTSTPTCDWSVALASCGIFRVDTQAASCWRGVPTRGRSSGRDGTCGSTFDRLASSCGRSADRAFFAVLDPSPAAINPAEERGQAAEILLLPGLERVVVALGAIEPDPEECPRSAGGQALGIGRLRVGVESDRDEIGGRVIGPEAGFGDQVADDGVVGPILEDRVAQPGRESAATELR